MWQFSKLTQTNQNVTRFEYWAKYDMKGNMPKFVRTLFMSYLMSKPTITQEFFQHQRKISRLTRKDGINMGKMLMNKLGSGKGLTVKDRVSECGSGGRERACK